MLQRWMIRALRAERRAAREEKARHLAERVAGAAMKRLSDSELIEVRDELAGESRDGS